MIGVPARQIGWMSEHGEQMLLPLEGEGSYICLHSGTSYELRDGRMTVQKRPDSDSQPSSPTIGRLPPLQPR